jgi:hypothetical protein
MSDGRYKFGWHGVYTVAVLDESNQNPALGALSMLSTLRKPFPKKGVL